jgi:hypothetical protein
MVKVFKEKIPNMSLACCISSYIESQKNKLNANQYKIFQFVMF